MNKLLITLLLIIPNLLFATDAELEKRISKITHRMHATVGVSVISSDEKNILDVHASSNFIMQSVFKLPLAITTLHWVELGKLSLQQRVEIPEQLSSKFDMSKLKDDHPEKNARVSVADLIMYSISYSDNLSCDVLFGLLGGCKTVDDYMHSVGLNSIHIKYTEQGMYSNHAYQNYNCCTPEAMNKLLIALYSGKLLKKPLKELLMKDLIVNFTSEKRLKGLLPKETIVAHKTGTGYCNKMVDATNDVGIIFLPKGRFYYISVFVMNAKETQEACERCIAEISKEVYQYMYKK